MRLTPGPYVVVSVSDDGEGMDAVTQASIFEPFFTTKGAGQGTGLGLSTVYGIVQEAGGAIYVYSEVGRGSVFKVYLPRVLEPAMAPDAPRRTERANVAALHATILLVEDEPGVRSFTAEVLESAGFQVLQAANGEEAIALVKRPDIAVDLLLADVVLPGMNGRVLSERLTAIQPALTMLFTSGYTDDMVVRTGVVTGGMAFLQKPFTPEMLVDRVHAVLTGMGSPASQ
jgi:CheY-like chemotaxis protein